VFFDGLVKAIGLDNALEWPTMFHLSVSSYHGGQFEGNACRKLLNSAQGLKQLKGDEKVLQIYFDAFTSYNALVSNLYSNSKVYVDQDCIHKMLVTATTDYMKLGITVTLKVHIVFNHLEEMLKHCFGLGLGLFSAQAIESSHREFLQSFWYMVKTRNQVIGQPQVFGQLNEGCSGIYFQTQMKLIDIILLKLS
jgi:hypothetical protein